MKNVPEKSKAMSLWQGAGFSMSWISPAISLAVRMIWARQVGRQRAKNRMMCLHGISLVTISMPGVRCAGLCIAFHSPNKKRFEAAGWRVYTERRHHGKHQAQRRVP